VRVIAGELGGRRLKSHERPGLRPTTDRVRESVFSMLTSRIDFDDIRVLDLFAGTGALGIEALSRGAAHCTFVESDRRTAMIIEENLRDLGVASRARVTVRDALKFVGETDARFDLVLADPPYAATIFDRLVHDLFERRLVHEQGLLLLEHSSTMQPRSPAGVGIVATRSFGDTAVTLYQAAPDGAPDA
jgi:16S rRNA (guanine966-N2)-methyltransferase